LPDPALTSDWKELIPDFAPKHPSDSSFCMGLSFPDFIHKTTSLHGTCFAFPATMSGPESKKNILVIDPDPELCTNVRLFLEESFRVYTRQSLTYIDYAVILNQIDLILIEADFGSDQLIPLITSLRQNQPRVKVVLMYTFFPIDRSDEKSLAALSDGLISKPFDVIELKTRLEKLLTNPAVPALRE